MKNIFVAGSGLMGSGIAQTAAAAGYSVTLYDVSGEALKRAMDSISWSLDKRISKGKMTAEEKAAISHRKRALEELCKLLQSTK